MVPDFRILGQDVRSYYQQGNGSQAYGSFWAWAGGWVSAYHVYKQQKFEIPNFANGPVQVGHPKLDVVLYGCDLNCVVRPRAPVEGERIYLYGAPQSTGQISKRLARVFYHRKRVDNSGEDDFSTPTWIGQIDQMPSHINGEGDAHIPYAQVSAGMSGGLVVSEYGEPLGILVMQTSPMDDNRDGINEQYFDFVSLRDVYDKMVDSNLNLV